MTKVFRSIEAWQKFRRQNKLADKSLGFIPTMGNLHAGHASLIRKSLQKNKFTVVSIFVNPTQFDVANDYDSYPRTLRQDLQMLRKLKVDWVLLPKYKEMYPDAYRYQVNENKFSLQLCGKHRPGHFAGMLTIVLKMLLLVQPQRAYFGEKDWQQLCLVRDMTKAFHLDVDIIGCSIVRDVNGLALSSRNSRLTEKQYKLALHFPRLLHANKSARKIIAELKNLGFVVDYIEEINGRRLGAVRIGEIRLIDNVERLLRGSNDDEKFSK
jgi:pantoate--beta-alanine ligase